MEQVGAVIIVAKFMIVQLASMIAVAITPLDMEHMDAIVVQKIKIALGVIQIAHMDKLGVQVGLIVHVEIHALMAIHGAKHPHGLLIIITHQKLVNYN